MRVPYSWLKEFVADLPDVDEVARRLTLGGVEVEAVARPDSRLVDSLVTARIVETSKHPNADRLTLCKVDAGEGVIPIVCGARNMKPGDAVVLAKPGTLLPDGRKIARSKIRGEESRGMLCSADEIGVASEGEGILILDESTRPGANAAELLGIDAAVLDLAVTPNRGDCLSVRGVAREIAALCGLELRSAFYTRPSPPAGTGCVPVSIEASDLCPFYTGIALSSVTVGSSPAWLVARLRAAGLRPINNVVDVTNYVLWEYGQPLHAFDRGRLAGPEIRVERARAGETIETLDGQRRTLESGDLVIRDAAGVAVALAGVMGGAGSAVQATTTDVFLESAMFAPAAVRKTSRRLGLISDSSYRFERGVDPKGVDVALLRAAELLVEAAGGKVVGGITRAGAPPSGGSCIELRPARITRILGTSVPTDEVEDVLARLGATVNRGSGGLLEVMRPSHRPDLEREIDLIEEIARVRGYHRIVSTPPALTRRRPAARANLDATHAVRVTLAARGVNEVIPLAFTAPRANERFRGLHPRGAGAVVVENPQGADTSELRMSLLPALLQARATNVRNGVATTDLYSIGRTFSAIDDHSEIEAVAGLFAGARRLHNESEERAPTFWDVKGVVEAVIAARGCRERLRWMATAERSELHPRAAAEIHSGSTLLGYAGEVHPDELLALDLASPIYAFELDLARLEASAVGRRRYQAVPRFPASSRDVSLLVPFELPADRVVDAAIGVGDPLLEHIAAFDEYRGEGMEPGVRALAFRLRYRALDRTLTEDEVSAAHENVLAAVLSALPVRRRA